jgi:ubiquitin C-terminal hydrolase
MNILDINNQYDNISCVIENGYNTCYLDSLLICLFYKENNNITFMLENIPKKPEGYYLQELIINKFISPIQRNYSISSNIINEIRNYSVICGWSPEGDIVNQKDSREYLKFLLNTFNISPLQIEIFEIKNNIISQHTQNLKIPYITLNITKDDSVHNLLQHWINSKIYSPDENIIYCYKLIEIPQFITLNINRFEEGNRLSYKIDIMKRIKFFEINDQTQCYIKWKIHGMICHVGDTPTTGHYYSVLSSYDKKWYIFDDTIIPSFKYIDLGDDDIKEKIMQDVLLIVYVLDT